MEAALRGAGVEPDAIDYVNLHGTGTQSNDAAEDRAVSALFGERVPCNSTKAMTGHALGAAGALEAAVALLAVREGFVPPGVNTRRIDPALRARYELTGGARRIDRVLSNSFGFGGSNCSLVIGRAGARA
jgi:3-oxoacyl-[acyl-carrier-protein] synthase-1